VVTERLTLRRFRPSDTDALAPVFAKPEVWRFPYGRGFTAEETAAFVAAQIAEWDACGFGCWLAQQHESGRTVGYVGLSVPHFLPDLLPVVEVGWRFDPDVWGRGYATEGAVAALDHAFGTLGLTEVCSAPQTENSPSSRVCERLGMTLERVVNLAPTARRGAVDANLYWMTAADWRDQRPQFS
jgi:RimJ/RimL family protein N-acetyltransferase